MPLLEDSVKKDARDLRKILDDEDEELEDKFYLDEEIKEN